jgi:hypothetical protein
MAGRALFVVSLLAGAPAAHAWQVVAEVSVRFSVELSCRATTGPVVEVSAEASTGSTKGSSRSKEPQADATQDVLPNSSQGRACSSDDVCDDAESCVNGTCEKPAEEPPMMLERKGPELYLRGHAAQLRQDVALGDGPVIAVLSATQHVPRTTLGRVMRANHRELLKLIGDDSDEKWPGAFLRRLNELSRPAVSRVEPARGSRGT